MLKTLRQSALHVANTSVFGAMLQTLDKVVIGTRQGILAVLTYHRVDHASQTSKLYPGLISATPEQFKEHLDLLAEIGQVVSMSQVLDACREKTDLPGRSVLITFDDACLDFAEYAWPALQSHQMPATVFVPTAYPDQPERRFWWDRLHLAVWHGNQTHLTAPCGRFELRSDRQCTHAFKMLRDYVKQLEHEQATQFIEDVCKQQQVTLPPRSVLNWDELRNLARQGVTLAPHTQTHPLLTRVSPENARQEIAGSRDDLKREIGEVLPVFAYPGGAWNPQVAEMLQQEGFEIGFSVKRGINDLKTADPLSMNRINIGQKTSTQILRAQLMAGWWKHRARKRDQ